MLTFYKGPRNAYDVEIHGDGIYFTTDTCEIIHDGKTYSSGSKIYSNGSDSEKTIIDIQLNENELTIEYSDGSTSTIPLGEYTAGTNIAIEDGAISALGYTWIANIKSFAEGDGTDAEGYASHAEGYYTQASGEASHAEGFNTYAIGDNSHAEGDSTYTSNIAEHAEGRYNSSNTGNKDEKQTISSIGIGTSNNDRKNAFEVMKNGDIYVYGLGNYDGTNAVIENADGVKGKPLQTAISNNTNRIQVVNVTNLPYKFTDRKVDTKLLFNLNCDAKTLYENQDDFYVTLSKYSNRRKKQIVLNDMIKRDERLKVYCWVIKNNSAYSCDWTYFYTLDDYDDIVESDPDIFTKRRPHCTERLYGSLGMSNNYINYIDELCYDGLTVSDASGLIERYITGDTDKYFVGNLSKNPIARWKGTYFDESEQLTSDEKMNFFTSYLSNLIFWRGTHANYDVDTYSFHSYVGDYPIYPVKLADCEVIVYGAIADELGFKESQGQTKLANLTLEQLQRLSQITLILPFKANYIVKRLYSPQVWDFEFRDPEIINKDIFEGACKIGGNRRLVYHNWASFKNYLKLGICNKRQLISNTFKDIPQYDFKLRTFDAGPYMKYTYGDNEINTLITRVM